MLPPCLVAGLRRRYDYLLCSYYPPRSGTVVAPPAISGFGPASDIARQQVNAFGSLLRSERWFCCWRTTCGTVLTRLPPRCKVAGTTTDDLRVRLHARSQRHTRGRRTVAGAPMYVHRFNRQHFAALFCCAPPHIYHADVASRGLTPGEYSHTCAAFFVVVHLPLFGRGRTALTVRTPLLDDGGFCCSAVRGIAAPGSFAARRVRRV